MRYGTLLPFVATAASFVILDEGIAKQLILENEQQQQQQQAEKATISSSWWDDLPSTLNDLRASAEDIIAGAFDSFEEQASRLSDLIPEIELDPSPELLSWAEHLTSQSQSHPPPGGHQHHHHAANLTVYQAIKASNLTRRFAALVDEHPDIVESLNGTSANVTAFVPFDRAFDKIPHRGRHDVPKEFLEKVVRYHVLPGYWPAGRVLAHRTLPTALESEALGGRPQRLRVSVGLLGVRINFYSKVKIVNLSFKNGIVHGVDNILVPPPPAGKLISLFPSKFSTLELAAQKTGFAHHHDGGDDDNDNNDGKKSHERDQLTGLTIFAPTNTAFRRLGPAANAFLFNTPRGLGFLRALLKYHVVANETLYSDAYYGKDHHHDHDHDYDHDYDNDDNDDEDDNEEAGATVAGGGRHYHVDLPTLLRDRSLGVDIDAAPWPGALARVTVNGRVRVAVRDAVAADGVVHVVDSVLVPPRKPGRGYAGPEEPQQQQHDDDNGEGEGEISVEELVERLGPYVTEEEGGDGVQGQEEEAGWQEEEL
ncbi:Fasciclin domain-containing protein [Biscogniauxia marginata]|nr:Fasciclin domain-containing protein [Biscogniauxia marginata]